MSGIYVIRCKVNGKCRIGSASEIIKRWSTYLAELRGGKYSVKAMQDDWNLFGEENFEFEILEKCPQYKLKELENHYIHKYDAINNGYNVTLNNLDNPKKIRRGKEAANYKEKRSKITSGTNNGHCLTDVETIIKIKKLINQGYTNKEIAEMEDIDKSANYISRIRTGDRWASVEAVA